MLFTDQPQVIPRVFNTQIHIGDAVIGGHGIFVIVVAAVALGATFWLLERTRLGLAMRSLSQDETTARMYGVSVGWVTVATWGIASALGALSGVLVGSFIQVDHSIMTTILIQSFAALVLGGFGSTGGAIAGGLLLGIASSFVAGFGSPAFKNTFVFAIILVVLIVRPYGLLGKPALVVAEGSGATHRAPALPLPDSWRRPRWLLGLLVGVAVIVALPWIPQPFPLVTFSVLLATAAVAVSLSLFMGYAGEFSLGHGALVTLGAYVAGIAARELTDISFLVVLLVATVGTALLGAVLGWITLRLSGVYFAIATLALTFVVTEVALQLRDLTGGAIGTRFHRRSCSGCRWRRTCRSTTLSPGPSSSWRWEPRRCSARGWGATGWRSAMPRWPPPRWAWQSAARKSWPSPCLRASPALVAPCSGRW